MDEIIAEMLLEVAPAAGYLHGDAIQAVPSELDQLFRTRVPKSVTAANRKFTLMCTGFGAADHGWTPLHALITNFQHWGSHDDPEAWEHFELHPLSVKAGETWPTLVQRVGAYDAVPFGEMEELRLLLGKGKPPEAVRGKMIEFLAQWSARSGGTIGQQASSMVVHAGEGSPEWGYHSARLSHTWHAGMTVITKPEGSFAAGKVELKADDPTTTPPIVVPRPSGRRQPCPCGSGRQYRLCHGRR
jgi:hypothetical protein